MKKLAIALAVGAIAFAPSTALAQRFGMQLGYGTETDLAVGARVEVDIPNTFSQNPPLSRAFFLTSFDFYFPDCGSGVDCTYWELTPALAVPFQRPNQAFTPYLGAGLSLARMSVTVGTSSASNTEAGLALLGGLRFPFGGMTGFTEARITLSDADQLTLSFGVLFGGARP